MSEIERLRALLAEATPGPWRVGAEEPEDVVLWAGEKWIANVGEWGKNATPAERVCADAALIAAAVNALPAMLDVADAARAYLASDGSGIRAKGRWSAPFDAMDHAHALGRLRKALDRLDGAS